MDERPALGHERDKLYVPTASECALYRFDEPPMLADGTLDPLAVLTLCDTMPMAIYERMDQWSSHQGDGSLKLALRI